MFQVGTQQRSEDGSRFLQAIAIVQSGRLGKNVNAYVAIGGGTVGGPFENTKPPEGLNWDMWVGPAQEADYSNERRKEFRWYLRLLRRQDDRLGRPSHRHRPMGAWSRSHRAR